MITGNPVQIQNGEIHNETYSYDNETLIASSNVITYSYNTTNSTIDYVVSLILLLTGLAGIGYVASEYYEERRRSSEKEVEGYDNE